MTPVDSRSETRRDTPRGNARLAYLRPLHQQIVLPNSVNLRRYSDICGNRARG